MKVIPIRRCETVPDQIQRELDRDRARNRLAMWMFIVGATGLFFATWMVALGFL